VKRLPGWIKKPIGIALTAFFTVWACLPLFVARAIGTLLGWLAFFGARSRRRVATINLGIAFPNLSSDALRALVKAHMVALMVSMLDRIWLWYGPSWLVRKRLRITGDVQALSEPGAIVLFVPHFIGLDAAGMAVTQQLSRPLTDIYTPQSNPVIDAWIYDRRQRFGKIKMYDRAAGVRDVVKDLKAGGMLALLPDMGFGPEESLFVPFFGVSTTTIPSLSRFARLGKARVIPLLSVMTPTGYDIEFRPAWANFPTNDLYADTLRMNQTLEGYIGEHPSQYLWVHRRYKHRPPGQASVY
jgi:KDO2-lipid IV(A) lauroyltransferase